MTTFRVSYICKHSDTNVIGQFLMRYNIWIIIVWIKKHGRCNTNRKRHHLHIFEVMT